MDKLLIAKAHFTAVSEKHLRLNSAKLKKDFKFTLIPCL